METFTNFTPVAIDLVRANSLAELLTACKESNVEVKKILFFQNGFQVLFEGIEGDAILHDGSYGRSAGLWESYQMPWDFDDVSVHTAKTLVRLIKAELDGIDWKTLGINDGE